MYIPHPVDTDGIELGEGLEKLTERIAENVHEVWAQRRINEGWTFGAERNDEKKQTPCLVPYSELPEEEKEYDRTTALSTLRLVRALGYRIEREETP